MMSSDHDPATPEPPTTGDPVVDDVLRQLASIESRVSSSPPVDEGGDGDDFAGALEAATQAHRALQQRLTNPEPTLHEASDDPGA